MARMTLFDTTFAQLTGTRQSANKVIKFLATNRNCHIPDVVADKLYTDRPLLETPSNTIFKHLRDEGYCTALFAPVRLDKKMASVPELLTSNDIVLDTAQLTEADILTSFPEFAGKVVINLGSILKVGKAHEHDLHVSDMNVLHSLYVRGALVMSYHGSNGWLSPSLGVFLAKSYSMTISGVIAKFYDLILQEQLIIASVLSLYMCQLLAGDDDKLSHPALFNRCTYLGNNSTLAGLASAMEAESSKGLDISSVCRLIGKLGPDRAKNFTPELFYRLTKNMCSDGISSMIAMEYPPYWAHQLVVAMSNGKTKLYFELKNNRLQEEAKRFLYELDNSGSFIGTLPKVAKNR